MQRILLGLNGKQIAFAKTVEDHDGSFDWVSEAYPNSDTRSYVLIDYTEDVLKAASVPFSFYDTKAKAIKAMKQIKASVNKVSIENDGVDTVAFTVITTNPMTIIVQQEIGDTRENNLYDLIPENGKIVVNINSDCLGMIRLSAIGETTYTETFEVAVV